VNVISSVVIVIVADNQDAPMMMLLPLFVIIAIAVENHNPAMMISIPISVPIVISLAHADRYVAFFRHHDWFFCRCGPRDYRGAQ
jgi:hypothetical protein